jgi:hypothetical protein
VIVAVAFKPERTRPQQRGCDTHLDSLNAFQSAILDPPVVVFTVPFSACPVPVIPPPVQSGSNVS